MSGSKARRNFADEREWRLNLPKRSERVVPLAPETESKREKPENATRGSTPEGDNASTTRERTKRGTEEEQRKRHSKRGGAEERRRSTRQRAGSIMRAVAPCAKHTVCDGLTGGRPDVRPGSTPHRPHIAARLPQGQSQIGERTSVEFVLNPFTRETNKCVGKQARLNRAQPKCCRNHLNFGGHRPTSVDTGSEVAESGIFWWAPDETWPNATQLLSEPAGIWWSQPRRGGNNLRIGGASVHFGRNQLELVGDRVCFW